MKTLEALRDELKNAEDVRLKKPPLHKPTKFFAQAMLMAEQSLNSVKKSPERSEVADWVTPVFFPIILKLARMGASAADSAGKRATLPTQKEAYLRNALDIAVEPWYQNPVFLRDLQKEAANERYENEDERFLIVEIWRDMAKLLMIAASLYPAAQAEPLINKSEQMWSSLYSSLEEGHPD